jgi:dihydroceramidase
MFALYGFMKQSQFKEASLLFLLCALIGTGSACFHATLTLRGQQFDEIAMMYHIITYFYMVNKIGRNTTQSYARPLDILLVIYTAVYTLIFFYSGIPPALFQCNYGLWVFASIIQFLKKWRLSSTSTRDDNNLIRSCLGSGVIGFGFWLIDYNYCSVFKKLKMYPLGHGLWHLFLGYTAYASVLMLQTLIIRESLLASSYSMTK